MKSKTDPVINALVRKKKDLLNQLLAHSIQTALDKNEPGIAMPDRDRIMSSLAINDEAIESRQKDLGVKAAKQEARLFQEIGSILRAIQDNNSQTISKLEKEIKQAERERALLHQGNKLSGYITQQNRYQNGQPAGMNQANHQAGSRLLDGTL